MGTLSASGMALAGYSFLPTRSRHKHDRTRAGGGACDPRTADAAHTAGRSGIRWDTKRKR